MSGRFQLTGTLTENVFGQRKHLKSSVNFHDFSQTFMGFFLRFASDISKNLN